MRDDRRPPEDWQCKHGWGTGGHCWCPTCFVEELGKAKAGARIETLELVAGWVRVALERAKGEGE